MKKILIVYFSVYGSTKKFAEIIGKEINADIIEIIPEAKYNDNPSHYEELASYIKKEQEENKRPKIKNSISINDYDMIFVGYPIWWYTLPQILFTFFDEYNFSGKTIIPFNTHEGSGSSGTYEEIKKLEPKATVLEGLAIRGSNINQKVENEIKKWLQKLNLIK